MGGAANHGACAGERALLRGVRCTCTSPRIRVRSTGNGTSSATIVQEPPSSRFRRGLGDAPAGGSSRHHRCVHLRAAYHDVVIEVRRRRLLPRASTSTTPSVVARRCDDDDDDPTVIIGGDPCGVRYVSALAGLDAPAWALIAGNAAAGLWCLVAHRCRRSCAAARSSRHDRPRPVEDAGHQLRSSDVLMARYDLVTKPACTPSTEFSAACSQSASSTATANEAVHARQGVPAKTPAAACSSWVSASAMLDLIDWTGRYPGRPIGVSP